MHFTINLATRRILDYRRVNRLCAVIIAALLLFLCWNVFMVSWHMGETRRLDNEISSLTKKMKTLAPANLDKDSSETRASISYYNEIIVRKSFGWLRFLEQVEISLPEGIALSGLAPDKKNGSVKIEGLARDFGKLRALLENLEKSGYFHDIQLVSHADVDLWEEAKGVEFSIMCQVKFQ